jgi:GTPase SAR1 family protein
MRIAMLGAGSSGKTTYMAAMYEAMAKGYKGFFLETRDPNHGAELLAAAKKIRSKKYPPPNAHRSLYDFTLGTKLQPQLFDFTWNDYRGGAISERATSEDTAAVHQDLLDADGIVVFADSDYFAHDPDADRLARRLTSVLQRALAEKSRPIPLVLAYTKTDLLGRKDSWDNVTRPLTALHGAVAGMQDGRGIVVRITCGRWNKNVHLPVLWCLSHLVVDRIEDLRHEHEREQREAKYARSKATWKDSWDSWKNNQTSWRTLARRHDRSAAEAYEQIAPLEEPARELQRLVRRELKS